MRQFSQGYLKIVIWGKGYVSKKRIFLDTFLDSLCLAGWGNFDPCLGRGFPGQWGKGDSFFGVGES